MKKRWAALLCAAALVFSLAACGGPAGSASHNEDSGSLRILATTYPVYCFTQAVTEGVDGVEVHLMIDQQVSCLHDYTLSVNDMRAIEGADVIVINGAGLEDFMADALAFSDAPVIDCSEGIALLPYAGHEDHDHAVLEADSGHFDPHIWMDPSRAAQMAETIAGTLADLDPAHADAYLQNGAAAAARYRAISADGYALLHGEENAPLYGMITFHDGFAYFADAFGLTLLRSIEEEAGSEASAKDIVEIVTLVREEQIPMIFVEENGSDATAKAIQRETGTALGTLTMMMGDNGKSYEENMEQNIKTVQSGLTAPPAQELEEYE